MIKEFNNKIAFQGEPGANGALACRVMRRDMQTLPCHTFEDTFAAVREGQAKYLLIPIDNNTDSYFVNYSTNSKHLCCEYFSSTFSF